MADDADIAAEQLEREMKQLLKARRAVGPEPTGECLWCAAPLAHPLRWCDVGWRDDWERHARLGR